ncbi:hypothetical protein ACFZAV_28010 [Streptomyces sp. NPDC008343]|uniref:hypothetical protein n=1 Tax=Streptomyces sp. NPDC008343 TaxID=3364828 RepID=UPI0036F03C28
METLEEPQADQDGEQQAAATRFEQRLRENQTEQTAQSVLMALRFWQQQGGYLTYGRAAETSCFPNLDAGSALKSRILWPIAIYPVSGTVEAVFQPLKIRAPFDDETQRRELMTRFNAIDGIDLAEAKIDLRPSFPLDVFAEHGEDICSVLEWFVHTVALEAPRRSAEAVAS